jgi:tyrosine-protein phosphatase SIW14
MAGEKQTIAAEGRERNVRMIAKTGKSAARLLDALRWSGRLPPASMKFTVRVVLVCLLLVLKPYPWAAPRQTDGGNAAAAGQPKWRHLKLDGVPDFGEVTPKLYRGGQPKRQGFEKLAEMGIDIVVDTGRSRRDEKKITELGMRYVSLPWFCWFRKEEVFAGFLKLIKENPDKKIFVHCRYGNDRTGMMIAAYRMGLEGWTAEEAMKEMQSFGYTAIHHVMCPGLARYEKSFPERLKKHEAFEEFR